MKQKTREQELKEEIEEREKSGVSEEHTGHWSYDDFLKAELKGILSERKNWIKWIDKRIKMLKQASIKKPKNVQQQYYARINELKELKKEIEK